MKTIKYQYKTFRFAYTDISEADATINKYIKNGWILESFETAATQSYVYFIYLLKRKI